jgi:hypothetical protein
MRQLRDPRGSMEGIRRRRVSTGKEDFDVDSASADSNDDVKIRKVERQSDFDPSLGAVNVGSVDYICTVILLVCAFAVRVYHISAIDTVIFDEVGPIERDPLSESIRFAHNYQSTVRKTTDCRTVLVISRVFRHGPLLGC